MDTLKNRKRETFCQIIAKEECLPAEAAFRAGYGRQDKICRDHTNQGSRLMHTEEVQRRIATIKEELRDREKNEVDSVRKLVYDTLMLDYGRYHKSVNTVLQNGRTVTDVYLSVPIEEWDADFRRLAIWGYNQNGSPIFADKAKLLDMFSKIYGMLDQNNNTDIEDKSALYTAAGLIEGQTPVEFDVPAMTDGDDEDEEEIDIDIH